MREKSGKAGAAEGTSRSTAARSGAARPATLERPRQIWGRRSVAVGGILVGLALLGALALLITGGDGDDDGNQVSSEDVSQVQDEFLQQTTVDPGDGISVRRPADWKVNKKSGVISIQSKSGCLVMQLSSPVPANKSKALRRDGIKVLRGEYRKVQVQSAAPSQLGGIPTTNDAITVTDAKGNKVTVLLSVGTGQKNAYLTQVASRAGASCEADLLLARAMLGTVQFTK